MAIKCKNVVELISNYCEEKCNFTELEASNKVYYELIDHCKKYYRNNPEYGNLLTACYNMGKGLKEADKKEIQKVLASFYVINPVDEFNQAMNLKVKKDYLKSFEIMNTLAKDGYTQAQYELGKFFYYGYGIDVDYNKAVYWFVRAAEKGDYYAALKLGDSYFYGVGVTQSYDEALFWYKKAATTKGGSEAFYKIGFCYHYGLGVAKNDYEAAYWLEASYKMDNDEAAYLYDFIEGLARLKNGPLSNSKFKDVDEESYNLVSKIALKYNKTVVSKILKEHDEEEALLEIEDKLTPDDVDKIVVDFKNERKLKLIDVLSYAFNADVDKFIINLCKHLSPNDVDLLLDKITSKKEIVSALREKLPQNILDEILLESFSKEVVITILSA
ncbi:MAG: tetratricopeptide repeat protein [Anaeroplasmataceae bacterium]